MASHSGRDNFFQIIPKRATFVFFLAVFFIFAPLGSMFTTSFSQQRPWWWWVSMAVISGSLAVSWAGTFTLSRWFAVGIVVFTLGVSMFPFLVGVGAGGRTSLETLSVVVFVALGYVMFVIFISGQGRNTVRLQAEMELARNIHETLVPPLVVENERIEILARSSASTEMGGDLVDAIPGTDHTDLFLIDVSGHGVRAGVVMAMIKSAIRMGIDERTGVAGLAAKLNDVIESTTSAELYATLAAIRVDHRHNSLEYLLAGHHHIVLHRSQTGTVERLAAPGLPLGMMSGTRWDTHSTDLATGDLILVYTDGLNETMDQQDVELGHEPLDAIVKAQAGRPLAELEKALFAAAGAHGEQMDDRSLLLARIR